MKTALSSMAQKVEAQYPWYEKLPDALAEVIKQVSPSPGFYAEQDYMKGLWDTKKDVFGPLGNAYSKIIELMDLYVSNEIYCQVSWLLLAKCNRT